MFKKPVHLLWITVLLIAVPSPLRAAVTLPAVIGDNMVMQRDTTVNIWGWADPGERVTVSFAGSKGSAVAGSDSSWSVSLDPVPAGGPYEMTVQGKNTVTVYDILVGDVWICSGQSNMHWPVKFSADPEREIAAANHPSLRLFYVKNQGAGEPLTDCFGRWEECTPRSADEFSALAYYFGRELNRELDVPVGLVQSSWGGTHIEAWLSLDAIEADPALKYVLDGWEDIVEQKPKAVLDRYDLMSAWFVYCFECMGQKLPYGPIPGPPEGFDRGFGAPSWLYNAMIAPFVPFSIKGFLWYQGESNVGRAYKYRKLMPALINDWRHQWGNDDLPFLFVQLANKNEPDSLPEESPWAELREAQLMALDVPGTGMAVTIDIGEADDVHFKNKQEAGRRLFLAALDTAYGRDVVSSGPLYDSMRIDGDRIIITFSECGSGLTTPGGAQPKGFAIAGSDSVFVWADARILDSRTVSVQSGGISSPVAVRYGWSNNPDCNLYNRECLPASPFRTDGWPGVTWNK